MISALSNELSVRNDSQYIEYNNNNSSASYSSSNANNTNNTNTNELKLIDDKLVSFFTINKISKHRLSILYKFQNYILKLKSLSLSFNNSNIDENENNINNIVEGEINISSSGNVNIHPRSSNLQNLIDTLNSSSLTLINKTEVGNIWECYNNNIQSKQEIQNSIWNLYQQIVSIWIDTVESERIILIKQSSINNTIYFINKKLIELNLFSEIADLFFSERDMLINNNKNLLSTPLKWQELRLSIAADLFSLLMNQLTGKYEILGALHKHLLKSIFHGFNESYTDATFSWVKNVKNDLPQEYCSPNTDPKFLANVKNHLSIDHNKIIPYQSIYYWLKDINSNVSFSLGRIRANLNSYGMQKRANADIVKRTMTRWMNSLLVTSFQSWKSTVIELKNQRIRIQKIFATWQPIKIKRRHIGEFFISWRKYTKIQEIRDDLQTYQAKLNNLSLKVADGKEVLLIDVEQRDLLSAELIEGDLEQSISSAQTNDIIISINTTLESPLTESSVILYQLCSLGNLLETSILIPSSDLCNRSIYGRGDILKLLPHLNEIKSSSSLTELTDADFLLLWINYLLSNDRIKQASSYITTRNVLNFGLDWVDGEILLALICSLVPGCLTNEELAKFNSFKIHEINSSFEITSDVIERNKFIIEILLPKLQAKVDDLAVVQASEDKLRFLMNNIEKLVDNRCSFLPVKINLSNFIDPNSLSYSLSPDMISILVSRIFTGIPKFPEWDMCPPLPEPPALIISNVPPLVANFAFDSKKVNSDNSGQQLLPSSISNKKNNFNSPVARGTARTPIVSPSRGSMSRSAAIKRPFSSFNPNYSNLDAVENSDLFPKDCATSIVSVATWVSKWIKYYSSLPEGEVIKRHLITYNQINSIFELICDYIQILKPWLLHFQLSNATYHQVNASIRRYSIEAILCRSHRIPMQLEDHRRNESIKELLIIEPYQIQSLISMSETAHIPVKSSVFDWSMNAKIKNPIDIEISDLTNILEINFQFLQDLFSHYTLYYPNLSENMFRFNEKSYWAFLQDFGLLSRNFTPHQAADIFHEVVILHVSKNNSAVSVSNYVDASETFFESMDFINKLLSPSQFICLIIYLAEANYHNQSGSLCSKFRFFIQQLQLKSHILVDSANVSTCSLKPSNIIDPFVDNLTSLVHRANQSNIYDIDNFLDIKSLDAAVKIENISNTAKEKEALSKFLELELEPSDDVLLFEFTLPDTKEVLNLFNNQLHSIFEFYSTRKFDESDIVSKYGVKRLTWKNFMWLLCDLKLHKHSDLIFPVFRKQSYDENALSEVPPPIEYENIFGEEQINWLKIYFRVENIETFALVFTEFQQCILSLAMVMHCDPFLSSSVKLSQFIESSIMSQLPPYISSQLNY